MLLTLKSWIPDEIKSSIKKLWHKIRPPRIRLTKFIEAGCQFEVTTRMEKGRVIGYGDEADSIQMVLSEIKSGDVFYDIGSCVGIYALHAAFLGCQVIAFEPDPGYRKRLKRNIQINGLRRNVKVLDWAVSKDTGTATLYSDGVEGNSPSLGLVGKRGSIIVKTNSIDNAILTREIPSPDLMKIDIEGAEILALHGMIRTLSSENAPRFLFIELHPKFLKGFDSSVSECQELLRSCGYERTFTVQRADQIHEVYRKGSR